MNKRTDKPIAKKALIAGLKTFISMAIIYPIFMYIVGIGFLSKHAWIFLVVALLAFIITFLQELLIYWLGNKK